MATTLTMGGALTFSVAFTETASADQSGQRSNPSFTQSMLFAATASLPTTAQISGWLYGTPTCAAGNWLIADATDPFQSMGDSTYNTGLTVAGKKIKFFGVKNLDGTNTVTIARGATFGAPIFDAASYSITLPAYGVFIALYPAGTATIATTVNDKITIAVGGGSPQVEVLIGYGT